MLLRRSDFLIAIEEYVGAKGNTLVDHEKRKNIKGYKRYKNIKGNVKIKVLFAYLIKGCRLL